MVLMSCNVEPVKPCTCPPFITTYGAKVNEYGDLMCLTCMGVIKTREELDTELKAELVVICKQVQGVLTGLQEVVRKIPT